ncbi:hypothetical protein [Neorhizobium galegae]|uniref:hypothetical protein n=1 Tax=Neorhizobium galegae TaxID=399 RepID=UPI0006219E3E|nr:hypothetical protein [Neorhizobium galegae]CDZ55109.1 Hypothetical protein NGAL_HAMBI2427_60090 [Neorhizobium galegae bv. orientalis]
MAGIVGNRYYNDPQIGQAFSGLAQMFAPPSGADLAGYATAGAKKAEAARLAELFTYAQDPALDKSRFDRMGQATGQWTPSAGYYGVDTTAATSRSNNAADNTRALKEREMQEAGALARLYATPVTAAEGATVYMPEQTAGAAGLPRVLAGNIATSQGERVTTPDGRVYEGAAKPLSAPEVEGQILQSLPATDQRAKVLGDVPVETVIMNGQPTIVRRNDAVGQQPAPPVSSAAPETQNYQTPDGKRGTAVFDQTKRTWIDTATGTTLPKGAITFNSSLQGGAADTGLGPTTANNTAANNQAAQITQALNTLDVYEQLIRNNPGALGIVGLIRGTAQNAVASATDLAGAFGKTAPQVAEAAADIKAGLANVAPEVFDPAIPEANFLQATLAYAIARTENPSGEVSRQAYDRARERISGGFLGNSQETLSNVGAYRKVLEKQLSGVNTLRDPNAARTDTSFQKPAGADAPVERWIKGPDGRPMRAN